MDKELTPKELGEMLKVSVKTITNYLNSGKLIGFKVGGRWRVPIQSVEEFLRVSNTKYLGGNNYGK